LLVVTRVFIGEPALVLGDRRSLPSSTGGRNIHYIEFQFEIPKTQRRTGYVQHDQRYSIVQPPVKPASTTR
jgi:hypothetical protein